MECNKSKNENQCTCSYAGCSRKGLCCECIAYHRRKGEVPGCLFPPEVEKTYDRSAARFAACSKR
ncbi:MAG: DUF6485 family protein [bacterium]